MPNKTLRCRLNATVLLIPMLGAVLAGGSELSDDTTNSNTDEVERLLVLAPQAGNARNSEGDLIRLDDGRLFLVWTRFADGDGG